MGFGDQSTGLIKGRGDSLSFTLAAKEKKAEVEGTTLRSLPKEPLTLESLSFF